MDGPAFRSYKLTDVHTSRCVQEKFRKLLVPEKIETVLCTCNLVGGVRALHIKLHPPTPQMLNEIIRVLRFRRRCMGTSSLFRQTAIL